MQKSAVDCLSENSLSKNKSYKVLDSAETIAANFSRKASVYDQFAKVQQFAAMQLDRQIAKNVSSATPAQILEIGCGTGLLSQYLVQRFPNSIIDFIDPAAEMLSICKKNINTQLCLNTTSKNHNFMQRRVEDYLNDKMISPKKYSLIVSSFAFHWLTNLADVLNSLIQRLEKGGQIIFSYPTNKSFPEWKSVCQNINLPFTGNILPNAKDLSFCAQANEITLVWNEYAYKLAFPDAIEFFREMKNTGAHSALFAKNASKILHNQPLSVKEFRLLLATWNQTCSKKIIGQTSNRKANTHNRSVDCTYWIVEGIITRHS